MSAVNKVAVVGAGAAGLAAAILLREADLHVDVYDAKPELSALGSGITLQGNALRVLDRLGVWDEVRKLGFPFEGLNLRAPGPEAKVVAALEEVKTGGPDYPAGMGMYRPDLAKVLLARAESLGARAHFGSEVTGLDDSGEAGVTLTINGATTEPYDLVIGADGLNSAVRSLIGIDTKPQPTGMGIWRTIVSRPAEVTTSELYYGGPVYIAGYTPTGEDAMYAFLVEDAQDRFGVSPEEAARVMVEESSAYHGPWDTIRADLSSGTGVNYTHFTSHLVSAPWNRGRVVIIGDAAHSCPPTVAQGAAQAMEDALVLVEELIKRDAVDQDLWDAFHGRRIERATAVVEASVQLGQWQLDHVQGDAPALLHGIAQRMAEPA
ncbi:FAD-dependent monooxygenase [Galactobacter sp.]|uniref:FAD-dependent monooxygenase n=1 Tax=Galactobacter sp. TaxID=2676125 RepID=UPI0025BEB982|nr:FAD-dependent monooxygenase [Galactobacter sp.]